MKPVLLFIPLHQLKTGRKISEKMTKEELFEKYSINESHAQWNNQIDNWNSVEIYRVMHDGKLPNHEDMDTKYVTAFLDKAKSDVKWFFGLDNHGSLFLTAKREVYRFADLIL